MSQETDVNGAEDEPVASRRVTLQEIASEEEGGVDEPDAD